MIRILSSLLILMVLALASTASWAWGERGHNGIARVAARLVAQSKDPEIAAFGAVLQRREHMLGHLSNVPDIVWRSAGAEVEAINAPSHFIDLDYILPEQKKLLAKECPTDLEAYKKALAANCEKKQLSCAPGQNQAEKLRKAGHVPFRIQLLSQNLTKTFAELKKLQRDSKVLPEARSALIDKSLLYAGILAHFVGDLSNPHHTSADYDGWHTGQGGLHSYFESELVDAQNLDLEQSILTAASMDQPAHKLFGKMPGNPLMMAWELALASHARIDALQELDRKYSLIAPSDRVSHTKAQRKPPALVAQDYHNFLVERLSLGADALAMVWIAAWDAAGRPELQGYQSFNYPVKPDFIPLDYMTPEDLAAAPAKMKP